MVVDTLDAVPLPLAVTITRLAVLVGVMLPLKLKAVLVVELVIVTGVVVVAVTVRIMSPGFGMPGPNTCKVVHELAHAPAVAKPLENSQKPIIRTASAVTPAVAYSVPPAVALAFMVVLVGSVLSQDAHGKIAVGLLHVATPSSGVPPL